MQIHPYTQMALGILTGAAQVRPALTDVTRNSYHSRQLIITQANLDNSISSLLEKVRSVYEFLLQGDTLSRFDARKDTLGQIAQVISNCAQFIKDYSETKNFCKRIRVVF